MKANLMATLILGDVMERGYSANVSEENAASILRVNPEYAGSMTLQNARKNITFYVVSKPKVNNKTIIKIQKRVLLKYKCAGTAVPAQMEGSPNIPSF